MTISEHIEYRIELANDNIEDFKKHKGKWEKEALQKCIEKMVKDIKNFNWVLTRNFPEKLDEEIYDEVQKTLNKVVKTYEEANNLSKSRKKTSEKW